MKPRALGIAEVYPRYKLSSAVTGVAPRQARCNVTPGERS